MQRNIALVGWVMVILLSECIAKHAMGMKSEMGYNNKINCQTH